MRPVPPRCSSHRYKRVCKIAFFLQLLFGWASVAMSSLSENLKKTANQAAVALDQKLANATDSKAFIPGVAGDGFGQSILTGEAMTMRDLEFADSLVHIIFATSVIMTFIIAFDVRYSTRTGDGSSVSARARLNR